MNFTIPLNIVRSSQYTLESVIKLNWDQTSFINLACKRVTRETEIIFQLFPVRSEHRSSSIRQFEILSIIVRSCA